MWLQNKEEVPDKNYSKQKMLLGTHTSEEEQNHLLLAEVHLPTEDSELESAQYDEESAEIGGYGASPGELLQQFQGMPTTVHLTTCMAYISQTKPIVGAKQAWLSY